MLLLLSKAALEERKLRCACPKRTRTLLGSQDRRELFTQGGVCFSVVAVHWQLGEFACEELGFGGCLADRLLELLALLGQCGNLFPPSAYVLELSFLLTVLGMQLRLLVGEKLSLLLERVRALGRLGCELRLK